MVNRTDVNPQIGIPSCLLHIMAEYWLSMFNMKIKKTLNFSFFNAYTLNKFKNSMKTINVYLMAVLICWSQK